MRTKTQKEEDLKKGRELIKKSQALIFVDFTKVSTQALRKLRADLRAAGAKLFILKKRLLAILLKEKGIAFDAKQHKLSLGAVFSEGDAEAASGPVYKFFASLEPPEGEDKKYWEKHIIGGYDLKGNAAVPAERIIFIGKLPPREALLAQLLGMLAAPIRGFAYLLQEKSKTQTPTP